MDKYKHITYEYHADIDAVEHCIDDRLYDSPASYIFLINELLEFVEYKKPLYVIINQLGSSFKIPTELKEYTASILRQLCNSIKVKRIIFLTPPDMYETYYFDIHEKFPHMIAFTSFADARGWIRGKGK